MSLTVCNKKSFVKSTFFLNFLPFDSIVISKYKFDMQKIQKFQFGRMYAAPKSTKTYELIHRCGHFLIFRVRHSKTRDSWKLQSTSTYKADANGAFEEVLLSDGTRLRGDLYMTALDAA